jgi:nucleoside-diphosphate-sugar epimerase
MRALVTGAAGFVGSHLCDHLLSCGDDVVGVDAFTDFYPRELKARNLDDARRNDRFRLVEADLGVFDLASLLDGIDVVYHLAAQPGVRPSWGKDFEVYVRQNIDVTQRLLEACVASPVRRFVYASSSSIYGNAESMPTSENAVPSPISPYGVTKLAAEHLCDSYRQAFGVPATSLRLFTVYGPRQRPDMAFARLIRAAIDGVPFVVYGDGEQTRDFTYVADVARAMRDCAGSAWSGTANIGGGSRASLNDAISIVEDAAGPVRVERSPAQPGDARDTGADISRAREGFAYSPAWGLAEGLRSMIDWAKRKR